MPASEDEAQRALTGPGRRFARGAWKGYFVQPLRGGFALGWMDLYLGFDEGRITGGGSDRIGQFIVDGRYRPEDGTCLFGKQYLGKHRVIYTGGGTGREIRGRWRIGRKCTGAFHLWAVDAPRAQAAGPAGA